MSSNFEWQKQQVDERVQGALLEAASHRLGRAGSWRRSFEGNFFKAVLLVGIVWFLIGLILTAITPAQPEVNTIPTQSVAQTIGTSPWTMAERIRFQDRSWEQALVSGEVKPPQTSPWMIADRIRFQDRLWEQYLSHLEEPENDQPVVTRTSATAD